MKRILLTAIFIMTAVHLFPQLTRPMTVDDLWNMERINSFDVSPDGSMITFSASVYSMDLNKGNSNIYLMESDGSNLQMLLNSPENESDPKFLPDGNHISYSHGGQIWICDLKGENNRQLTDLSTGASGALWSADGSRMLFISSVFHECGTDECNETRIKEQETSKVQARIITELLYRHWDSWRGDRRSHLFLYDMESGETLDLTQHSERDVPPISLGSGKDYTFSPDGKIVSFVMNTDEMLAASTNNDVIVTNVPDDLTNGAPIKMRVSLSLGNDNQPVFSPDGNYLAYASMMRKGFEADKVNIILYNRNDRSFRNLTDKFELSVEEILWGADSKTIYLTAQNGINVSIYKLDVESEEITMILEEHYNSSITLGPGGSKLYFKQQRADMPYEIFSMNTDGSDVTQLTAMNQKRLSQLELSEAETFWVEGADGTPVESILIKPPFFNAELSYPLIFLVHGGPQGAWSDNFHYRWNYQLFAAEQYVVIAPNPRGSRGYGQKFTDEISGDWGGKVYEDLMNVYDYAVANFTFIDPTNTFAAGASYGGYMINWIAGHTDRFNALVSHDGVFNLESMYGTTEELWFPEWENKGTPWTNRELYDRWSPHRYIHNCSTPMLIIHGANDFRVSEEQAFQLFTYLQRLGVKSKFLYFPDESHFVLKPQNSRLWWNTVYGWFVENQTIVR